MVIDSQAQLEALTDKNLLIHPIPTDDRTHPNCTKIIAFAIRDLQDNKNYIVSVDHPEALFHIDNLECLQGVLYCTDLILMRSNGYHLNCIDLDMANYLTTNKPFEKDSDNTTTHFIRSYPDCDQTNKLIGLQKLQERLNHLPTIPNNIPEGLDFYTHRVKGVFSSIQSNGIKIKKVSFDKTFGKTFSKVDDKCYTQYNYYTTTGRPSNRFGGVNFAALAKEDETRTCFVSRFGQLGSLVELDFNSYHPRIIASLIGYDFGDENVYAHLAKHYHNTDTPTDDQINKAKEDTFRQLYGGIRKDYLSIPFFKQTHEFAMNLWSQFKSQGYIESPLSGRRLQQSFYKDINASVLFNYYIQMMETELNTVMFSDIFKHLAQGDLQSVPVLYTYDSMLFDVHAEEFSTLVDVIIPSCIDLKKYPIKVKVGDNYKNLVAFAKAEDIY